MFSLGFSEILIISVIALIFLGPEKLPEAARFLGRNIALFRRTMDEVRNEIYATRDNFTQEVSSIGGDNATGGQNIIQRPAKPTTQVPSPDQVPLDPQISQLNNTSAATDNLNICEQSIDNADSQNLAAQATTAKNP